MHYRNWTVWIAAAMWVAVAACSKDGAADKPLKMAAGGPAEPELGWAASSERAERAPISLTASDGTGLALVSLRARTVIEDPLAFTELHLTFHNPEPRRREGRFEITLPDQAAISRFAMRVGDAFQEGEVVERRRAQQVYEDFLHRKQDPALLEKDAGNEFAARVFPIEAQADKEIILAYSEELTRHDEPYVLRLHGLPQLGELDVEVRVGGSSATGKESTERARGTLGRLALREQNHVPQADLEVRLPWQKALALRNGNLVLARVAPVLDLPAEELSGLTVLVDTSASRALGFGAQIERLGALIAALQKRAGDFDLRVVAFDQTAEDVYSGTAGGFGLREQSKLITRDALGATDLGQALAFVASRASRHTRVLVIGDGVVTAGPDDTTALREAVARLAAHGVRRLDVLAEGGIRDRESLLALTRAGLPSTGVVLDARAAVPELVDKLLLGTRDRIEVQIAGATWTYPSVLQGVQPGDAHLVFAELPPEHPVQIELVGAGAEAFETLEVPRPLLERAWARARIEAQSGELRALRPDASDERARLEQEIVELSLRHRVVSDHTALLVLETDADYRRFGIARNALTSILRVGDEGIELFDRTAPDAPRHDRPPMQIAVEAAAEETDGPTDSEFERQAATPSPASPPAPASASAPARAPAPARARAASAPAADERHRAPAGPPSIGALGTGRGGGMRREQEPPPQPEAKKEAAAKASAAPAPARAPAPSARTASRDTLAERAPAAAETRSATAPRARSAAPADALAAADGEGGGALVPAPRPLPDVRPLQIAAPALQAHAEVRLQSTAGVPSAQAAQVLRGSLRPRARQCYERAAARGNGERLVLALALSDKGSVADASVTSSSLADAAVRACIVAAARALRFPKPEVAGAAVQAAVELSMREPPIAAATPRDRSAPRPRARAQMPAPAIEDAVEGVLAEVLAALARGDKAGALASASQARAADPGDVIALIALGEAVEAQGDFARAARVYGSLIDLFPSRADLRRMASARLERLPSHGLPLAVDSYRRAVAQRPDHPSGHRALAYALWKNGDREGALAALEHALDLGFAEDRFEGVGRILREDLQLIAAALLRAEPSAAPRAEQALAARGLTPERAPSLRFVLSWETDANDVDFHLYDGRGGHAYYMKPRLPSGGALYADITTGYGPECFSVPGRVRTYPYVLQAHYYARGPMGYGMGKLQVIEHDGHGGLAITEHPFVIMKDKAFVELARVERPLLTATDASRGTL